MTPLGSNQRPRTALRRLQRRWRIYRALLANSNHATIRDHIHTWKWSCAFDRQLETIAEHEQAIVRQLDQLQVEVDAWNTVAELLLFEQSVRDDIAALPEVAA